MTTRDRSYSWEDPAALAAAVALAKATLADADGSLYGHATANCMVLGG